MDLQGLHPLIQTAFQHICIFDPLVMLARLHLNRVPENLGSCLSLYRGDIANGTNIRKTTAMLACMPPHPKVEHDVITKGLCNARAYLEGGPQARVLHTQPLCLQ